MVVWAPDLTIGKIVNQCFKKERCTTMWLKGEHKGEMWNLDGKIKL